MQEPPQRAFPRPWHHPVNQRFGALVLAVLAVALVTRFNACDRRGVVQGVSRELAATEASVGALRGDLATLGSAVATVDSRLVTLQQMEHRVIYRHDPRRQDKPDAIALEALRDLVRAGAELRVVLRPAMGQGEVTNIFCVASRLDENGNVLCTGPERPSNLMLPDGRRYQETIRHDGTLTFAHWDATGGNVQGQREIGQWATVWLARGPLSEPAPPPPPSEFEAPTADAPPAL